MPEEVTQRRASSSETPDQSAPRPLALTVVAALTTAVGLAPAVFAGWMLVRHGSTTPSNESVYEGTTIYLVVLGVMVLGVAAGLWRGRGWAFGGAVFVQLIALAVTYEMARAEFWPGAVALGASAVISLGLLFTRSVRSALGRIA